MLQSKPQVVKQSAVVAAGLLALVCQAPALAQQSLSAAQLLNPDPAGAHQPFTPFPLVHAGSGGGLTFDLGGSDQRKLHLRLAEPLLTGAANGNGWLDLGDPPQGAGASLNWLIGDQLRLGAEAGRHEVPFQSLGAIHCENGVLAADSYTASGCYFVDRPGVARSDHVTVGGQLSLGAGATASFNVFQQTTVGQPGLRAWTQGGAVPFAGLPGATGPLPLPVTPGEPIDYLQEEISGIDLEFQLGFTTSRAGDMRLGLQLTRILDGNSEVSYRAAPGVQGWQLSGPADSARLSFDWSKGAFSGGFQSYYRAPVEFFNRSVVDGITTFDVQFTWRAPWNASFIVGASNLLNSGAEDAGPAEISIADRFESVYGRIPYVRYQQDL